MKRRIASRYHRKRSTLSGRLHRPFSRPRLERLEDRRVLASVSGLIATDMTFTDPTDPVEFIGNTQIASGVKLEIGANVPVTVRENVSVSVDGVLKFNNAAPVFIQDFSGSQNSGIVVNGGGTLDVANTDFLRVNQSNGSDNARITVEPGGMLMASDSRFDWDYLYLDDGSIIEDPATGDSLVTGNEFDLDLYVPWTHLQDGPRLANNLRFEDVYIINGAVSSGQSLDLDLLGTATTANLRYVIPNGFTVQQNATLTINQDVPVLLRENQLLTVDGTLTFDNASAFMIEDFSGSQNSGMVVNGTGTLEVINTDFLRSGGGNNGSDNTRVTVQSGGTFRASDSRFDWDYLFLDDGTIIEEPATGDSLVSGNEFDLDLYVPWTHLQDGPRLANNLRFEDVNIINGAVPAGESLGLNLIGTATTANLRYVFPSGFTVQQNASLTVNQDVPVLLRDNQSLTVDGTLTFDNASAFMIEDFSGSQTSGMIVNGTGTLEVINTDFLRSGGGSNGSDTTRVIVQSGGTFRASDSRFDWDYLFLDDGTIIEEPSTGVSLVSGNEFDLDFYVPWTHLQDGPRLANNFRFEDVNIIHGAVSAGESLDLNLIGTATTANLRYVFPSGFTVQQNATLIVGQDVPVLLRDNQLLTVDGTLTFDNASAFMIEDFSGSQTSGMVVNGTGTLEVINTDFLRSGGGNGSDTTRVIVQSGGTFRASDSRFDWDSMVLGDGTIVEDPATGNSLVSGNEFDLDLYVPWTHLQDGPRLSNNLRFEDIYILNGAVPTGESLDLNLIGINTTANLRYIFPGGFTVQQNAALTVGQDVIVLIKENQLLTIDGTLKFDNADSLMIEDFSGFQNSGMVVNGTGTLEVINTDFSRLNGNNGSDNTRVIVQSGGTFRASDSRFDWDYLFLDDGTIVEDPATGNSLVSGNEFVLDLYVPWTHLQDGARLANNLRFEDVYILNGAIPTGQSLDLNLIGTATTANLRYVFPSGFTVQQDAAMAVNRDVPVLLKDNQVLTVDGTLTLDNAASLMIEDFSGGQVSGMIVNGTGTLDIINTNLVRSNGGSNGSDSSRLSVAGVIRAEQSLFRWDQISLLPGSVVSFNRNDFDAPITINDLASSDIRINDFSNSSITATGDPNGQIDLRYNYWGTTVPDQIEAMILHKNDDINRPLVVFMPPLTSPRPGFGVIAGTKFDDLNNNGVRDADEPGLGGVRVYVDVDNDGQFDAGEPFSISAADDPATTDIDETGRYAIIDLIEGTHVVREVVPTGFQQTFPIAGSVSTTIEFDGIGPESGITAPGTTSFAFAGARFFGGTILNTGMPELNASGLYAYEVTSESATVQFDRPIDQAQFFFVHAGATASTAIAYGVDGAVLGQVDSLAATVNADPANFVSLDPSEPIAWIEFSGGIIDQFSFASLADDQSHLVHLSQNETAGGFDFGNHRAIETLVVTQFLANNNGFVAHFNRPLDVDDLNLYDDFDQTLGLADVVLQGQTTGIVHGSLVLSDSGQTVTFVATGGTLPADNYTVTMRSAADGFKDTLANLLDGNEDATAGDDFVRSFAIASAAAGEVTITIPDFARGAGQAVNLPGNTESGIPVLLSTGLDVSSVDFELAFDPALLTISDFGTQVPGAASAFHLVSPGLARVTVSSPDEFSAVDGVFELGRFTAVVPESAPYAAKQVLDIRAVQVRDNSPLPQLRPIRDDDAVHVAAYFGDTNASQSYSGGDVVHLQRVIVGSASGFADYQLIDPRVVADIDHSVSLTGGDTTLLQRVVIGTPVDFVPAIPAGVTPQAATGPDPLLYIPTDLEASPTTTVAAPVMLEVTEADGITLSSVDLVIEFDPDKFVVENFRLGALLLDAGFTDPAVNIDAPGIIRVTMSTAGSTVLLPLGTIGALLEFDMTVNNDAPVGASPINLRANFVDLSSTTYTNATNVQVEELTLLPSPTNDPNDAVDGSITVMPGVQRVTINDGTNNRSQITSLTVQFNSTLDHQLLESAFELYNTDKDIPVGIINVDAVDTSGTTSATLTFAGSSTVPRGGTGGSGNSLADGNYRLKVFSQYVTAPLGGGMTADYAFGEQRVDAFFRFFGDSDGDRDVDGQEYGRFGLTFLRPSTDPNFNPAFDFDGDGDVDGIDYGQFGQNFLKSL